MEWNPGEGFHVLPKASLQKWAARVLREDPGSLHTSPQMEGTPATAGVQASNHRAPFHLKSQGSSIQTGRGGPAGMSSALGFTP